VGRVFPEKALAKGLEQGFDTFQTIKLLSIKAKQKSNAVQGTKYLTKETRAWAKKQSKFPVQVIKELDSGELNLHELFLELTEKIEEDDTIIPNKEIKDTKPKK
jgi:hypothetical protein